MFAINHALQANANSVQALIATFPDAVIKSARRVQGTDWVTRIHNAEKYGRAGMRVCEYEITFEDGTYGMNVTGKDRQQAIEFAQIARRSAIAQNNRALEVIEHPEQFEQSTFVNVFGGGMLKSEKVAMHRDAVASAVARGDAIPLLVALEYPEIVHF